MVHALVSGTLKSVCLWDSSKLLHVVVVPSHCCIVFHWVNTWHWADLIIPESEDANVLSIMEISVNIFKYWFFPHFSFWNSYFKMLDFLILHAMSLKILFLYLSVLPFRMAFQFIFFLTCPILHFNLFIVRFLYFFIFCSFYLILFQICLFFFGVSCSYVFHSLILHRLLW